VQQKQRARDVTLGNEAMRDRSMMNSNDKCFSHTIAAIGWSGKKQKDPRRHTWK